MTKVSNQNICIIGILLVVTIFISCSHDNNEKTNQNTVKSNDVIGIIDSAVVRYFTDMPNDQPSRILELYLRLKGLPEQIMEARLSIDEYRPFTATIHKENEKLENDIHLKLIYNKDTFSKQVVYVKALINLSPPSATLRDYFIEIEQLLQEGNFDLMVHGLVGEPINFDKHSKFKIYFKYNEKIVTPSDSIVREVKFPPLPPPQ